MELSAQPPRTTPTLKSQTGVDFSVSQVSRVKTNIPSCLHRFFSTGSFAKHAFSAPQCLEHSSH